MSGLGPCPLAGQLLADMGAEVITIDRAAAKSGKADPTDINRRNKQSISLDLKSVEGLEIALKLIERADILIEGFRPGVMEKLGLGPEACLQSNPKLIFGRMTGWGQTGPLAKTAGHDLNYLAITGALSSIGTKDKPPIPPLNLVADYGGGTMFLLFGVLSALFERSQSGEGQVVDAAMVDGVPAMMGLLHSWMAQQQWTTQRESNLLDGGAPFYRCYETADSKYLSVGPLEPKFFAELIEKAEISNTHTANQYDRASWPDKHEQYEAVFLSKSQNDWMELFEGSDACVAPVLDITEVESHPHNLARKTFTRVDGVLQANPAPRFSRTSPNTPKAPTAIGADSEDILQQLGYSIDAINQLKKSHVLT
jgi:alpha-methylacyl-CoA racemase